MVKTKKFLIFFMLISCFFILISSASAADFHVKDKTSHKDITNWMKNAKNGNSLIFDGSSYNLTDTVKINRAINLKSTKNTQINFSKNKPMFNITTGGKVSFSGLTLNYYGKGSPTKGINIISADSKGIKKVNFSRININSNRENVGAIEIPYWEGSISNSKVNMKGDWGRGISSINWKGNLVNSQVSINSLSVSVYSLYWAGKVSGSKIYNHCPIGGGDPVGIIFVSAKGTISKCKVEVPNGAALRLDKNVKVSGSTIKSKKGTPKIYRFVPDLSINKNNIVRSKNTYSIKVSNVGLGSSSACYLGIKVGSYVKTVKVKALAYDKSTTVKITIPSKYISKKYTKTVKIDYYNKIKEEKEDNNIFKFN